MTDTHIKIKDVVPKVQYTGNGVTTSFPYEFAIFDESDMVVYLDDEIQETGYTVSGEGQTDGGNVTFTTAPADGVKITLIRQIPIERVTDFQEGGTFRPKNLNDEFDRQTAFLQQVQETLTRAVKVGPTSEVEPEEVLTQVERVYQSIDNVDAVADDIANVNAVASDLANVDAVAGNQTNIDAVAGNATNINAVAGNATNINAVNANKTNIDSVAGNKTNIDAVAGNATNINAVNANKTNIDAAAGNSSNINTVAGKSSEITTVASNISNINAVAGNSTNINAVAGNATNINAVAGNESDIDTVAGIASDVSNVASNSSDVSNVATNMSDVNNCATNMAAIQDAPNQAQAAADSAALAYQYGNDKINQTHITNCITEIPQDIKYTVSGDTVTILAGSKIWYPNGSGTFSSYTLESNKTHVFTGNKRLVVINMDSKSTLSTEISQCSSGSSQPASTSGRRFWYDTTNNQIKVAENGSSSFTGKFSFPLLIQYGDGTNAYVDQVFNGFGYIGSTVFVLPNIKSLNPQGFNADGTLKSELITNNSVKTFTHSGSNYGVVVGQSGANNLYTVNAKAYFEQPTPPTTFDNGKALWFNTETNYFYRTENSGSTWIGPVAFTKYFSLYVDNNGKITNLVPYHTFRALNYYDKDTISGWSMPSTRYIDLTLGASGALYTAPANGYVTISKNAGFNGASHLRLFNKTAGVDSQASLTADWTSAGLFVPVKKGDVFLVDYSLTGQTWFFQFVYAEGENV